METPFPTLHSGSVLVRNHFSAISVGTEGKTIKDAKLSYLGKAKARQNEVKKVIDAAKTHGVIKTYQMVMNKLETPSPLGYSCAGEVIAVADDVKNLKVGDFVACGGNSANHSEVVCVPTNLCAKLNDKSLVDQAAFTTIGAIALQGVRQAEVHLGETCLIIGMGILGQITAQLLQASGVKAIGIDIDPNTIELANKLGYCHAFHREDNALTEYINNATNGIGVDAVIITAGTSSTDPVNFGGEVARQKANIVVVGAIPTGFERKNYFQKELNLKMSCSYGPGRYDTNYEDKGVDYPVGYVRWTENRNMQAFIALLESGKIDLKPLTTHLFDFADADKAYDLVLQKNEFFCGLLLKYDTTKELKSSVLFNESNYKSSDVNAGFIGAGSFTQNFIFPNIKDKINLVGISTSSANSAKNAADKYGFDFCTNNIDELLKNEKINTVFITTPHHLHAPQVLTTLDYNKNVYVEKPLCLQEDELYEIADKKDQTNGQVMVGFNRRFSPAIEKVRSTISTKVPVAINYRINAGHLPASHWVHDPQVGGGRIIGEVCHFIDLCCLISGDKIETVNAVTLNDPTHKQDTLTINLGFRHGSIASINYFSNGSKKVSKEYLEIFSAGTSIIIDDFKKMTINDKDSKQINFSTQDKGHKKQFEMYVDAIKNGKEPIISFRDIFHSTLATFKVIESIQTKQTIVISD